MKKRLSGGLMLLGLVVLLSFSQGNAQPPQKAARIDYTRVAAGGPGVSNVVCDDKGRIVSALIVGRSRISTVLGASRGREVALQRASLVADAEFVKWLGSKVTVHESDRSETTLFLQGAEGNDGDALSESGKSLEKTSAGYRRVSQGLVRGLQLVHREVSASRKELTVVKKWQ